MLTLNNPSMYSLLSNLSKTSSALSISNIRLSSGLRVNSAADDPSGIIAAARYASHLETIDATISNANRISSIASTADGALSEIGSLLASIEANVIAASGDSATSAEIAAYQENIDLAVDAIDRLVDTTSFDGQRLLDGTLAYNTTGVDTDDIGSLSIRSANTSSGSISVEVSATGGSQASITFDAVTIAVDTTMTITGPDGSATVEFTAGDTKSDIQTAINAVTAETGVTVEYAGGAADLYLKTEDYGSDMTITLNVTEGAFATVGGVTTASGDDGTTTVNGTAVTRGSDHQYYYNSSGMSMQFSLTDSFFQSGGNTTFSVSGDGSGWALDTTASGQLNFGIDSLDPTSLGTSSLGYLSSLKSGGANAMSTGNFSAAEDIAEYGISRVSTERARIGALQSYTIGSTINSLTDTKEATTTALSNIMDLDYATETANNNRLQMMMEVGASILASMSQLQGNSVLTLLGGISR
ncbi:MAG: hypothetical protein JW936_09570 [Sedimentisphaerales bacterium]|nr:hypothetical protein [Sedimentisphaerales bacterium]